VYFSIRHNSRLLWSRRFEVVCRRPLGSVICSNKMVSEGRSNLLQSFLLGFSATALVSYMTAKRWSHSREKEVGNDEEKERASHEDIVVILLDMGKSTGSGLGDWVEIC